MQYRALVSKVLSYLYLIKPKFSGYFLSSPDFSSVEPQLVCPSAIARHDDVTLNPSFSCLKAKPEFLMISAKNFDLSALTSANKNEILVLNKLCRNSKSPKKHSSKAFIYFMYIGRINVAKYLSSSSFFYFPYLALTLVSPLDG